MKPFSKTVHVITRKTHVCLITLLLYSSPSSGFVRINDARITNRTNEKMKVKWNGMNEWKEKVGKDEEKSNK